ncbi:MAG: T9SS type A sorting domain-containing protein [Bacteroidia bacterium]|nr:T9SS type A sorting domain-containing protein [Bacteroidia bacterium]
MKSLFFLIIYNLISLSIWAQVNIEAGVEVLANGPVRLVLDDMDWKQDGAFSPGNGRVIFKGMNNNSIMGDSLSFYQIEVNKNTSELMLSDSIRVLDSLFFSSGLFDLAGKNIDLSNQGSLATEIENSRLYSSIPGGTITRFSILNNPTSTNPGNLGLSISASSNLDTCWILRGHDPQSFPGGDGIKRYYQLVTKNAIPPNSTIGMNYMNAELNGLPEQDLLVFQSPDSSGLWSPKGLTSIDTSNNYIESGSLNSILDSRFTLASFQILPVEGLVFNAYPVSDKVKCEWELEYELGIQYYEVEKSTDGNSFIQLGREFPQNRGQKKQKYQMLDNDPFPGLSYYRLKKVEIDGTYSYSSIVEVNFSAGINFGIYPNPTTNSTSIRMVSDKAGPLDVKIYDVKGKELIREEYEVVPGKNTMFLDLSQLPKGVYTLEVKQLNFVGYQKLIKK